MRQHETSTKPAPPQAGEEDEALSGDLMSYTFRGQLLGKILNDTRCKLTWRASDRKMVSSMINTLKKNVKDGVLSVVWDYKLNESGIRWPNQVRDAWIHENWWGDDEAVLVDAGPEIDDASVAQKVMETEALRQGQAGVQEVRVEVEDALPSPEPQQAGVSFGHLQARCDNVRRLDLLAIEVSQAEATAHIDLIERFVAGWAHTEGSETVPVPLPLSVCIILFLASIFPLLLLSLLLSLETEGMPIDIASVAPLSQAQSARAEAFRRRDQVV
nr:uncharacterized protein CTRU02_15087 [Colletotrichum truncatum]KAF6781447.1 hypothetical protein CTRU02_15087 [Colletotrichum truncatum]